MLDPHPGSADSLDPTGSPPVVVPIPTPSDVATKPGWTTTEFWTAVGAGMVNMAAIAALVFRMTPEEASNITGAITQTTGALAIIAGNVFMVWKYIHSRQVVKQEDVRAGVQKEAIYAEQIKAGILTPSAPGRPHRIV